MASLYVWLPVVLTIPPLRSVDPAASVVRVVSLVGLPTAASKVVMPLEFTVNDWLPEVLPSIVLMNVTFPEAAKDVLAVTTTALLTVTTDGSK